MVFNIVFCFFSHITLLDISGLNLILSCTIGILGVYLVLNPFINLLGWSEDGKKRKINWESFKKYHHQIIKNLNDSHESLNEEIAYLPQLFVLRISKSFLLKNFSKAANDIDNYSNTYLFLKYADFNLIKNIVKEFLAADGYLDPKYYNTSGNFVEGYGL